MSAPRQPVELRNYQFADRGEVNQSFVSLSVSTTQVLIAAAGASIFRDIAALAIANPTGAAATVTVFDDAADGAPILKVGVAANTGLFFGTFNPPLPASGANKGYAITSTEDGVTATIQTVDSKGVTR